MVSVNDEKKLIKIFLCASAVSLLLHAGFFLLVFKLNKTWGWIPFNESFFEVSIVSLMEKPAGSLTEGHPSDAKKNIVQKKSAQKSKKSLPAASVERKEKAPENNPPETVKDDRPGDSPAVESDMALLSNASPAPAVGTSESDSGNSINSGSNRMNSSGGGGAGGFGSKMNYLDMVRVKIENHKKYPDAAQQRNIEGQVTVEFTIQLDGRITEPSISKSSGYPSLDLAAIDAVKKASPFSSPPRDYFSDTIHINLPIRFELIR